MPLEAMLNMVAEVAAETRLMQLLPTAAVPLYSEQAVEEAVGQP